MYISYCLMFIYHTYIYIHILHVHRDYTWIPNCPWVFIEQPHVGEMPKQRILLGFNDMNDHLNDLFGLEIII